MSALNHFGPVHVGTAAERAALSTVGLKISTVWIESDTDQVMIWLGAAWAQAGLITDYVITSPATAAQNTVQPSADVVPLTLKGHAGATANLHEWQASGGTVLAKVEADGTLVFADSGTYWFMQSRTCDMVRVPGSNAPTWQTWAAGGGVLGFSYQAVNDEEIYARFILHGNYKEGSDIVLQVRWTPNEDTVDDPEVVRWGLEYEWRNVDETAAGTTTIYAEESMTDRQSDQIKTTFAAITGTGKEVQSVFNCRLFRNSSHANDTFDNVTALALFMSLDLLYECDTLGLRTATTK